MSRLFWTIGIWILMLVVWMGAAAQGTGHLRNYELWSSFPNRQLMEMGESFYNSGKADSALVCYNIIVNRYHSGLEKNGPSLQQACEALNQLGVLYTHYYFNNDKAKRYLLESQKIANDNHFNAMLYRIYTNLGNIKLMNCVFGDSIGDEQTSQFRLAFITALEVGDDPVAVVTSGVNWIKFLDDTTLYRNFHDDIDLFLNYQLPDSLKEYSYAKVFARAIQEKGKRNYNDCLRLLDSAYAHVYHRNVLSKQIIAEQIIDNKCRLLIELHRHKEATELLKNQLLKAQANGDNYRSYIYSYSLYEYYRDIAGDSVMADSYEFMALRCKDKFVNQSHLLEAENAEFLFQIDEINTEVQELTIRHRMTKIIAWGAAAFTLIVLILLYMLWRKYLREQEKNHKLYENNLALLAAEDERRQRMIEQQATKYQSHQVEKDKLSDLMHRILYVMETSEEIYNNSFSLDRLTELVDGGSRYYVSQTLNEHYHQSFSNIVNDYRIREACRRINDTEHYGHLTIEGIAQSVGFKSYPNFVSNFKKFTGLTPNVYRKQRDPRGPT